MGEARGPPSRLRSNSAHRGLYGSTRWAVLRLLWAYGSYGRCNTALWFLSSLRFFEKNGMRYIAKERMVGFFATFFSKRTVCVILPKNAFFRKERYALYCQRMHGRI